MSNRQARRKAGSQFGGNVQENTIQPKNDDALTSAEKLRLGYLTQSMDRADAEVDPLSWLGIDPNSETGKRIAKAEKEQLEWQ